ncbi:MAG: phosphoribosylamine--glycine ligase [Pelagibacterales bacterium]|nr:phosphoribosylamine--glycine ligase [Pelagibacterales bacterium]OUV25731.1 MAG: phosphoribosylamine--glycine ligase [Alphaproteobacteria bacterium TMED109]|tara:strand:- start:1011 stop:2270 length:1260 start_codon:yes stop_codon:yes gene_type:complete
MKVLVLGSGAREHAMCWSLANSPLITKLICAPGNPGIKEEAECIDLNINNNEDIISLALKEEIDLVIPGPEIPLVNGIINDLNKVNIKAFGPSKEASKLEGSKKFTKEICKAANIPTANYESFTNQDHAINYIKNINTPIVIKADGLAAGKGVIIAKNKDEAILAIENLFKGIFGEAGKTVLIEEYLEGIEASYFALCDGKNAIPLTNAQDHKRVGDGDTGPNTGGMGAFSPTPNLSEKDNEHILNNIIKPTLAVMHERGTPFQGILYAGLMLTNEGPKLIEYNVRFGDPECQVILSRIKSNLFEAILAAVDHTLNNFHIRFYDEVSLTVVMATEGYPGKYKNGSIIKGISEANNIKGIKVFHAGTKIDSDQNLVSNGGRVLSVTANAESMNKARILAYSAIKNIKWDEGFYRKDIGEN